MFSVVIPVAGSGALLKEAVASAVSPLVESIFVVADDAAALPAALTCQKAFERVTVLKTEGEGARGAGAARNVGLAAALEGGGATWLAFLDADDTFAPGYFDALAELLASPEAKAAPVVHTRLMSLTETDGRVSRAEVHPLRYRFEGGSRFVSLAEEPHMIGTSVAAAVFSCAALAGAGTRFAEGISWSEDSDFMVRFLLDSDAQRVGVCADARYEYRVKQGGSTTESAWANPLKYTLPFERFYLPWAQAVPVLPVWLQNQLLYEMSIYLQMDRQVLSPTFELDPQVLTRCAGYLQQVLGHLDSAVIENFALVPLGLDRRQMFLAVSRQVQELPYYPVTSRQVFRYARRPWRDLTKFTYFYTVDGPGEAQVPAEVFEQDSGAQVPPVAAKWVSHRFFGVELVRERILWFDAAPASFRIAGHLLDAKPYAGAPLLLGRAGLPVGKGAPQQPVKPGLVQRTRKGLWHLARRLKGGARASTPLPSPSAGQPAGQKPAGGVLRPEGEGLEEREGTVWFYADRAHRAGDNAEAFYRYARSAVPGARHVFLLDEASDDWARLRGQGFDLVPAGSEPARQLFDAADTLLLSDISDPAVSALLGGVKANQRLVFLQHGILRRDHWRWLNPRRVDLMVTTLPDETRAIIGDGSSYTLSAVEVLETGLPRHDRLLELAAAEKRRDRVLVAPTWSPELQGASAGQLGAWVEGWLAGVAGALPGVEPVLFVHPNLERRLAELALVLPCEAVFGAGLPEVLVRSVAVVSDVSSVADEGLALGIPVVLGLDTGAPGSRRVAGLLGQAGVSAVAPGDSAGMRTALLAALKQGRRAPAIKPGARRRLVSLLEGAEARQR